MFDLYSFAYGGGIYRQDYAQHWAEMTREMDLEKTAAPVDADPDGVLLRQAIKEHQRNVNVNDLFSSLPFRDSVPPGMKRPLYALLSPGSRVRELNRSGVAVYHLAGWFDMWSRDAFVWYNNLHTPQKLIIGPWHHGSSQDFNLADEHLRWYDYWLKGVANGIMEEPPIHYYTLGASTGEEWKSATRQLLLSCPAGFIRPGNRLGVRGRLTRSEAPNGNRIHRLSDRLFDDDWEENSLDGRLQRRFWLSGHDRE
jgi:putative CocE/NonD family hydrolase